jgi:hypothetical protein
MARPAPWPPKDTRSTMPERARVTSVEALESFRANLIVYLSKARPTLEETGQEVLRMRQWLENDRRPYWENELRRRQRKLQEAEQALFSAKLSQLQEESAAQLQAVRRAKSSVEQAESKRDQVRRWTRDFENRSDPLTRQIGLMQGFLASEMSRAVAHLTQVIDTLEAYAQVAAPGTQPASTDAATSPGATPLPPGAAEESKEAES